MSDHVAVTDPQTIEAAHARILAIRHREQQAASRLAAERQNNARARLTEQFMREAEVRRRRHEARVAQQCEAERRRAEIRQSAASLIAGEPTTLSSREIISVVASAFGFTHDEVIGPRRRAYLCQARFAAIHAVSAAKPHLSLPAIGRLFGDRDHTTILHALRKTEANGVALPPVVPNAGDAR